jgi:hypothetical protein
VVGGRGTRGLALRGRLALGNFRRLHRGGGPSRFVFRARLHERVRAPAPDIGRFLGTLLYGYFFSYLLRIYHLEGGMLKGVVFILGVKGNDISAYFVGRTWGA